MQKNLSKKAIFKYAKVKNIISILIVAALILTSTLSVATTKLDYGDQGSDDLGKIDYSDVQYSYNSESEGVSYSDNVDFDEANSFDLLPQDGQEKIIGGKNNLETLREKTISQIKNVKDRISERLNSKSSNMPLLSKLFGTTSSFDDGDPVYTNADSGSEPSPGTSNNDAYGSESSSAGSNMMGISSTGDDNDSDGNVTIIPNAGHIYFEGHGSLELDMILDINGTIVTIIGSLDMGSDVSSVDILWNLSQGYFEISGDSYFEFSGLYLNIDDSIIFNTDSLIIDAFGHIMIDHRGFEGDFFFDGVLALEGLSFDVNIEDIIDGNISVSADLDFSKIGEADGLSLSWGEDGISADGNFVGSSELNIYNLSVEFVLFSTNIVISADYICIQKSTIFEFIENEDEGLVFCSIKSSNLLIEGLYLGFGGFGVSVDTITVDVSVTLELELIDPDQYITEEEGHISIGGCFAITVDTVIYVEGTTVEISGTFKLDYGFFDIQWDKSEGFFKISSTTIVELDDVFISIDGNWVSLGWDELIFYRDGFLVVEQIDDSYSSTNLKMSKCSEIAGFYFDGAGLGIPASLNIGSIVFIDGSLFEINWYNNTVIMDLNASLGYGLIIHGLDFEVMKYDIEIGAIIVLGTWEIYYDDTCFEIKTEGFIEISDFSVFNTKRDKEVLGAGYFSAAGESEIRVLNNGKVIIGLYSVESYLRIGSGIPMVDSIVMELYGSSMLIIDFINRTLYGWVDGYGFVGTGGIKMGAIHVGGVSAYFDADASFSLVGTNFVINIEVDARFTAPFYVDVNAMLFNLHNFGLGVYGTVVGGVTGSITASVDLSTGAITYGGGLIGGVTVFIDCICGYGKGTWGNFDLNNDDLTDIHLRMDEIWIDFRDTDIVASVTFYMILPDGDLEMSDYYFKGHTQGTVTIDGLHFYAKSSDSPIPGQFHIDHIEIEAEVTIMPSCFRSIHVEANATASIEGFHYLLPSGLTLDVASLFLDSGNIEFLMQNPPYVPEDGIYSCIEAMNTFDQEIRINGEGAYVKIEDVNLGGEIIDEGGSRLIPSGHINLIQFASETSSFSIYKGEKDTEHDESFVVVVDGSDGLLHIEGVEDLGATLYDANDDVKASVSVDIESIDLALDALFKVYKDGTIEVNCAGTFNLVDLNVDIVIASLGLQLDIQVSNVDVFFGGEIIIHPGNEDTGKPPVVDVEGEVVWDVDGDIESEGSIYVDGRIIVDWEREIVYNQETGEWEEGDIWYVDIVFDSVDASDYGVFIDHFTLNTVQAGFPIEVNIDNYWGTGMFEFSLDLHEYEIFMDNQVDAVWEDFSFDVGPISAEIYHFWGDLKLSDIQVYSQDNGIDFNMDSQHGYLTYVGFKFSTDADDDFDLVGDVGVGEVMHITNMHLDAGTTGSFETYEDERDPGVLHIRINCDTGNAEFVGCFEGEGGIRWWFSIYCRDGNDIDLEIPNIERIMELINSDIGTFLQELSKLGTGEADLQALSDSLDNILDNLKDVEGVRDLLSEHGEFLGWTVDDEGTTLAEIYEQYKDQMPDWLREKFEKILNSLYRGVGNSCFLEGTKIEMADGSLKNIEDLVVGDKVASYDVTNDVWTTSIVTELFHHAADEMTDYYLILNDDLRITPNHPIMVDSEWIDAGELQIGDNFGGNIISSITRVYSRVPTFNFEVETYHTYNVVWGESSKSVVHNAPESAGNQQSQSSSEASVVQKAVSGTKNPCFLEDTKIGMANGSTKFIQDIEIGDHVLSYDILNETWTNGTVVEVDYHTPDEMPYYYVVINNDLRVTPNHPVYIKSGFTYQNNPVGPNLIPKSEGDGKWVGAGDLQVGQQIDGQIITSLRQVYHREPTYNFKVEPFHNYRVVWGETNSIAHSNESYLESPVPDETDVAAPPGNMQISIPPLEPPDDSSPWGDKGESCFLSGTQVEMSDGSLKNIEEISIGDKVTSYDEISGEYRIGVVNNVFHHSPEEMTDYYMIINGELCITPNHPVFVDGEWVDAADLKLGDDFGGNIISSIEYVYKRVPTYNFEVEPYHTYNIVWCGSDDSSIVHNENTGVQTARSQAVSKVLTSDKKKPTCFLKDTKIQMYNDSLKNIQDVKIGDTVKAYDAETASWKKAEVVEIFHHSPEEMADYYMIINNDLSITPNHPVLIDEEWIEASNIQVGDDFGGEVITSISRVFEKVRTYNFDVEPYHTYNVIWGSTTGSVVHNADVITNGDSSSSSQATTTNYVRKNVISGTKYGMTDVADAGLKAKIKLGEPVQVESLEIIPKTYKNDYGEIVVINEDSPIISEEGQVVEVERNNGWSVETTDNLGDRTYEVKKYEQTVQDGLESIGQVKNYIKDNVVNNPNHGYDEEDGSGSCCFPAGTLISMSDGSCKLIEDVEVGEYVLSYDTNDGVFVSNVVKEMVSPVRGGVYSINDGLVLPTDDHPFYTMKEDGRVGWAAVDPAKAEKGYLMVPMQLEVGDSVFTSDEEWVEITSIEYIPGPVQTFNLEDVSGSSNFFANGILVHNALDCKKLNEEDILKDPDIVGGGAGDPIELSSMLQTHGSYSCQPGPSFDPKKFPIAVTMDNIYYPAESITPGDIIKAYNTETNQLADALVTNASMTLTEGKYVDVELMQYSLFQEYEQQINDLENYIQMSGSEGDTITPLNLDPCKKIFFGVDQFVKTLDGLVKAEDLEIGDRIKGYVDTDEDGPSSSQILSVCSVEVKRRVIPIYNIVLSTSISNKLSNYIKYAGIDYDDSVHHYIADGAIVGDELARNYAKLDIIGFPQDTKVLMSALDARGGESIQVSTEEYYKDIKEVKSGDLVVSYDIENDTLVSSPVLETSKQVSGSYLSILLSTKESAVQDSMLFSLFNEPMLPDQHDDGSDGGVFVLKVTPNHPIYTYSNEKSSSYLYSNSIDNTIDYKSTLTLKKANELKLGDIIQLFNKEKATVVSIESVDEHVTTCNLIIDEHHNYFADNVLVNDNQDSDNIDKESRPGGDASSISLEPKIEISTLKEEDKPGYISDTICFDYYNEADYGYFKENADVQLSTNKISTLIYNMIKMLVEKFPSLSKFKIFEKYLEDKELEDGSGDDQETIDDANNDEDVEKEESDDETTIDDQPDDGGDKTPSQVDDIPEENIPEETNEEVQDNPNIMPISRDHEITPLQRDLLDIIEENSDDSDVMIHYIWDFGDGNYKYGINATHNYDLGHPESLDDDVYSFSGYPSDETFDEIVTYLVTLLIVDKYGNIVDMDMSSVTIESTWSVDSDGYSLVDYSIKF